jgi:nucleoside 2-deoxyribosyltransferase
MNLNNPSKQRIIYLAGPMENVSEHEALQWRDKAKEILHLNNVATLDPCRRIHDFQPKYMRRIFELDLRDIQECDLILANLNDPKLAKHGTAMEVFYAAYVLRKPVVAFKADPTVLHPFFESLVTEWRSDVTKACETIIDEYL